MVRKIVLGVLILLVVFPLVSALDTKIKIKTMPSHKVNLFVYLDDEIAFEELYIGTSDIYGDLEFVHSSAAGEVLDILVKISRDGVNAFDPERFEDYKAGEDIWIRIDNVEVTGNYVEEVAEEPSEDDTEIVTDGDSDEVVVEDDAEVGGNSITGAVVSDGSSDSGGLSKIVYLVIAAVLIVLVVAFLAIRRFNNLPASGKKSKSEDAKPVSEDAKELRGELMGARREIKKLKNEGKIKEVESKINQEKEELDKLRRGDAD